MAMTPTPSVREVWGRVWKGKWEGKGKGKSEQGDIPKRGDDRVLVKSYENG
jgi:hypothetical protein